MQTESLLIRTKKLLASHDLRARKGLGQNFLVDGSILKKIAAAAELTSGGYCYRGRTRAGSAHRDIGRASRKSNCHRIG